MYIDSIMHTDLITIAPEATLTEARNLIEKKKIDHLLVVNAKKKLVGLVSDRDLKQYWASPATSLSAHELNYLLEKVVVSMVMVKTVVTVPVSTTIERAAYIMQQHRISALPVMDGDELVGIITSTDVMGVLLQAIGISSESVRLTILVRDTIGRLAEVADALRDRNINIQSLFCWPESRYPGITQMVLRVAAQDCEPASVALNGKGFKVMQGFVKDITPYLPK